MWRVKLVSLAKKPFHRYITAFFPNTLKTSGIELEIEEKKQTRMNRGIYNRRKVRVIAMRRGERTWSDITMAQKVGEGEKGEKREGAFLFNIGSKRGRREVKGEYMYAAIDTATLGL